ncbi:MAG TPA: glutamine-hydrolyzing carbamoyl-phosphate synthase small subunit [Actinomycetota bacterium]|nr:glutamine-hydrolyzing carbamoyl-phosphate synthase small subunit [Actinomycetota bacterium]
MRAPAALLALEDGTVLRGSGFGAEGEAFGEAVFNTGMAGYQEILTDPSYAGQIVTMTAPQQGNYGMHEDDAESDRIQVAGFAVREAARRPSSRRAAGTLGDALLEGGVVAIEGIDTRRLTRRIRDAGAMRAAISTVDPDPASLVARVRGARPMSGADLARTVSTAAAYDASSMVGPADRSRGHALRVAVYDFGVKRNILRMAAAAGLETSVVPAETPATDVLAGGFQGVLLSNGPGDPAATRYGVDAAAALLGSLPVFGICLGHQLLALALGGRTYKMPFGHRGVNQPVRDARTGAVRITSHNHGFAVDPDGWERRGETARTPFGAVELTHRNLNDDTLEGLRCRDVPAFSVQYHPEAAPGPHDAGDLFTAFRDLIEGRAA